MESPLFNNMTDPKLIETTLKHEMEAVKIIEECIADADRRRRDILYIKTVIQRGMVMTELLQETNQFIENVLAFEKAILKSALLLKSLSVMHLSNIMRSIVMKRLCRKERHILMPRDDNDEADGGPSAPKYQRLNE